MRITGNFGPRGRAFAALASISALAACSGSDTDEVGEAAEGDNGALFGTEDGSTSIPSQAFIAGTATGAVETSFELAGVFKCQDDGIGEPDMTAEIIGTGGGQQVAIRLPYDQGGVGTFELLGSDDARYEPDAMEIRYRAPGMTNFRSGSGELVVAEWPETAGDSISGSFTATLENDGETVELAGEIAGSTLREFECAG